MPFSTIVKVVFFITSTYSQVKMEYEQQRETFSEEKNDLDEQLKEIQEKLMEVGPVTFLFVFEN